MKKIKVAINGYGVIGKRVADAVSLQDDMELIGVCDVVTDWRIKMAVSKSYLVYGFDQAVSNQMKEVGIPVVGSLDDMLQAADIVIDCTPKKIASQNLPKYRHIGFPKGPYSRAPQTEW